jgi:hypothetical protein
MLYLIALEASLGCFGKAFKRERLPGERHCFRSGFELDSFLDMPEPDKDALPQSD